MKILKLLNKKYLSIIIIFLSSSVSIFAEDKPIDIWNIDKKGIESSIETNSSVEKIDLKSERSVYDMQADKNKELIKLDSKLASKTIKIVGLYDPEDYGLDINMWTNSDGLNLKNLFENIDKYNLSNDASEILNISLLTNAYITQIKIFQSKSF